MSNEIKIDIVRVNNGRYTVFVIQNDEYIGPTIAHGHEWDGWMRKDIQEYYKEGTEILDIGANIGYNALMFSDYGPVYAYEPVYHEIVDLNIKHNTLKNDIFLYGCALSNVECTTRMYIPERGCQYENKINYGGTSLTMHEKLGNQTVNVECKRLDDIYTGTPSIIKIDVEGHELQVLEGAIDTIKKHKPTILIEIHDFEKSAIPKFLESLGYDKPHTRPESIYLYRAKDIFSTI